VERLTRAALPALLFLGLYYAFFGGRFSVFDLRGAEAERIDLEEELLGLERENAKLRTWADALEHDPAVLERIAREKYRMVKPGERVYLFEEDAASSPGADAADDAESRGG
jgi:cell division protein FtsB